MARLVLKVIALATLEEFEDIVEVLNTHKGCDSAMASRDAKAGKKEAGCCGLRQF